MVSTHNMMISTINPAKSTEAYSYTSSEHSTDCESGPWSACSSTDMCTPMPHMTSHPITYKRFSNASDRSLTSATQMSAASLDMESMDHHSSKFPQTATPPTHSETGPNASSEMIPTGAQHLALHPDAQAWSTGENGSSAAQSSATDGSHAMPPSAYAFNNWCPESTSRAPFDGYYSTKPAPAYAAAEHCRAASYHSTASSTDSWISHNQGDMNSPFPQAAINAPPAQMNANNFSSRALPGMNMLPATHSGGLKQSNLMAAQASLEAFNLQNTSQEARSLFDSLTPVPPAYSNTQLGLGPTSLMDSQTLLAYNAAFGASPLLYLYGLTPDLLAARSTALAQLANVTAAPSFPAASAGSVVDDGPSPANKKTNLYKTELCRSWEEKGTCRYGSKCQFAHGQDELKNVSRHPKFKTEVCRTFWLHGSCPYGKRCCFLHTTSTEGGAPTTDSRDINQSSKSARNAHDPPTSRLQKRVSANPLSVSATSPSEKSHAPLSSSPPLQPAPVTRSLSDFSHSRSNSNSSCSLSSDGSSHIDSLRIQIWPRFGTRDQVPPQDAPGPRSRLQRLRPTEDYTESPSSLPSTSTLSTTRYSPFVDRHQPPHSAFSDISSILARSPSQQIAKAHSATGTAEAQWPLSRLPSSANTKA